MSYLSEEPLEQLYLMRVNPQLQRCFGLCFCGTVAVLADGKEVCCLKEVLVKGHFHHS